MAPQRSSVYTCDCHVFWECPVAWEIFNHNSNIYPLTARIASLPQGGKSKKCLKTSPGWKNHPCDEQIRLSLKRIFQFPTSELKYSQFLLLLWRKWISMGSLWGLRLWLKNVFSYSGLGMVLLLNSMETIHNKSYTLKTTNLLYREQRALWVESHKYHLQ